MGILYCIGWQYHQSGDVSLVKVTDVYRVSVKSYCDDIAGGPSRESQKLSKTAFRMLSVTISYLKQNSSFRPKGAALDWTGLALRDEVTHISTGDCWLSNFDRDLVQSLVGMQGY